MSKSSPSEEVIFENTFSDEEDEPEDEERESGLNINTDNDYDNVSTFLLDLLRPQQNTGTHDDQIIETHDEHANTYPRTDHEENVDSVKLDIDGTSTSESVRQIRQSVDEEIVTTDDSIVVNPAGLNEYPKYEKVNAETEVPIETTIDEKDTKEKSREKKTVEIGENSTTGKGSKDTTVNNKHAFAVEIEESDKQESEAPNSITDDADDDLFGGQQVVTTTVAPQQRTSSQSLRSMGETLLFYRPLSRSGQRYASDIMPVLAVFFPDSYADEEDDSTLEGGYKDGFSSYFGSSPKTYQRSPRYRTNGQAKVKAKPKVNKNIPNDSQEESTNSGPKAATKIEAPPSIIPDKKENTKTPPTENTDKKSKSKTPFVDKPNQKYDPTRPFAHDRQTSKPGSKTPVVNADVDSSETKVKGNKGMTKPRNNQSATSTSPVYFPTDKRVAAWTNGPWHLSESDFIILDCDVSGVPEAQSEAHLSKQKKGSRSKRYPMTRKMYTRRNTGVKEDDHVDSASRFTQIAEGLKEKNVDMSLLMETANRMYGSSSRYAPCMQCYEQRSVGDGYSEWPRAGMATADGRCTSCGGALKTKKSLDKSILGLKTLTDQQGLVAVDVFPDGNCQFASVLDQLRSRGDFSYSPHTIRLAAVNYLREHPYADEDTHLQMFLADEQWDEYLTRMSCDGEWGDHLTLNALCNVIDMKIVVYKGVEKATAVLIPDRFQTKTTDDADEEKQLDIPTIFIAHMDESHYISLRNKDWRTKLLHRATQTDIHCTIPMSYNIYHIDCLIKLLTQLDYIYSLNLPELTSDDGSFEGHTVGHLFMKMHPEVDKVKTLIPSMLSMFKLSQNNQKPEPYIVTLLMSANGSRARTVSSSSSKMDLIIEPVPQSEANLFHLVPTKAKHWSGYTQKAPGGREYLMSDETCKIVRRPDQNTIFHELLSFACSWPQEAEEWPCRHSTSGLPSTSDRQQMMKFGCHAISAAERTLLNDILDIHVTAEMAENNALWCYSFAVAEKYLCSTVLSDYHRKAFLVFKLLVDQTLTDQPLPTSVVKSVYYYGCERILVDDWRTHPGTCVLTMLQKLINGLEIGHIPHYFIPSQNLLANIPEDIMRTCAASLSHIQQHPLMHLFFILDSNDILETEIGIYFDSMVEDMVAYSSNNNFLQTVCKWSYNAACTLIGNLAMRKDYDKGFLILRDIIDQMNLYTENQYTVKTFLRSQASTTPWLQFWYFTTYIDILTESNMVEEFCKYWQYETVPISELFGTQLPARIHQRPIPYRPEYGDMVSGLYMISVLEQCSLHEYRIPALRFYINKLAEDSKGGLVPEIECQCHGSLNCSSFPQLYMGQLFKIYKELLCLYQEDGRIEEFRSLMTTFGVIVESLQLSMCYKWLSKAWEWLGEKDEARRAMEQTKTSRSSAMMGQMMMIVG